jgi:hypothetical protein
MTKTDRPDADPSKNRKPIGPGRKEQAVPLNNIEAIEVPQGSLNREHFWGI